MTILQDIPALCKDRVNEMLEEAPVHKRYISKVLTEFNTELRSLNSLNKDHRIKAVNLFTEWRMKSLEESVMPEKLVNHMKNLIQTIGKIEMRKLSPKWALIDSNNELLTKWYLNLSRAEKIKGRLEKNGKIGVKIVSWNDLKRIDYEKKSNREL